MNMQSASTSESTSVTTSLWRKDRVAQFRPNETAVVELLKFQGFQKALKASTDFDRSGEKVLQWRAGNIFDLFERSFRGLRFSCSDASRDYADFRNRGSVHEYMNCVRERVTNGHTATVCMWRPLATTGVVHGCRPHRSAVA